MDREPAGVTDAEPRPAAAREPDWKTIICLAGQLSQPFRGGAVTCDQLRSVLRLSPHVGAGLLQRLGQQHRPGALEGIHGFALVPGSG